MIIWFIYTSHLINIYNFELVIYVLILVIINIIIDMLMEEIMKNNITGIIAWVATGVAISVGIIITHNPLCLFALLIPAALYD